VIIAVVFALSLVQSAAGQAIVGAQTASDNAAGAGGRAPGDMVAAGVAQSIAFSGHVTIITEPDSAMNPRADAIAASLDILFQQLNIAIAAFHNLLLARAGLSPVLPASSGAKLPAEAVKPGRLASPERLSRLIKARGGIGQK